MHRIAISFLSAGRIAMLGANHNLTLGEFLELANDTVGDMFRTAVSGVLLGKGSHLRGERGGSGEDIAVVDRRHPLAGSGELSIEAFRECELLKFEGVYLQRSWCHIEDSCVRHGFKPKVRSFYCSNIAELLASCAHLGPSALIVGRNFADRIPQGIRPFCSVINIQEEDVAIPLHFLYREDNQNPLLKETVQHLEGSDTAPFRFTLK